MQSTNDLANDSIEVYYPSIFHWNWNAVYNADAWLYVLRLYCWLPTRFLCLRLFMRREKERESERERDQVVDFHRSRQRRSHTRISGVVYALNCLQKKSQKDTLVSVSGSSVYFPANCRLSLFPHYLKTNREVDPCQATRESLTTKSKPPRGPTSFSHYDFAVV